MSKREGVFMGNRYDEERLAQDEAMLKAVHEARTQTSVTIEYNRSILEDKKRLDQFKEDSFKGKKTVENDYGKGKLHSDHKAAKRLYGQNASFHQADVDHIVPVKNVHDFATSLNYVTDSEVKNVINKNSNYKVIDRHTNASKREKTNFEYVKDHPELSAEQKAKMIRDGVVAGSLVYGELLYTDLKNAGREALTNVETLHDISVNSASIQLALVLEGKKDIPEALIDTTIMVAKGEVANVLLTEGLEVGHIAISQAQKILAKQMGKKAADTMLADVTQKALGVVNDNMGDIVTCAIQIGGTVKQFVDGEITGEELIIQTSHRVATQCTMKIGQQLGGAVGAAVLTPIVGPIVGKIVGEVIGGAIGFVVGDTIITTVSTINELTKSDHISKIIGQFEIINAQLEAYIHKLQRIDIERAYNLLGEVSSFLANVEMAENEIRLVDNLWEALEAKDIKLQFDNHETFKSFMKNKDALIL